MSFNEANTVEQMILDAATKLGTASATSVVREEPPAAWYGPLETVLNHPFWTFIPVIPTTAHATQIPRTPEQVIVEPWLRETLIKLNPAIAEQPGGAIERATESD